MSSLSIDHSLVASAFNIPLNSNSNVFLKNKSSMNEKEQKTTPLDEQSVDNEKLENQASQQSEFRVTGLRFIILFSG